MGISINQEWDRLRERLRADGRADERAAIVADIRRQAKELDGTGWDDVGSFLRGYADRFERGDHLKPEGKP